MRKSEKVNGKATQSDALVLFGVTGDLAHKMIFPALYAMAKRFGRIIKMRKKLPLKTLNLIVKTV